MLRAVGGVVSNRVGLHDRIVCQAALMMKGAETTGKLAQWILKGDISFSILCISEDE
jgi:hypothetical protein